MGHREKKTAAAAAVLLKKKVFLDTCSHVPSPAPGQSTPNRPTAFAGPARDLATAFRWWAGFDRRRPRS